MDSPGFVCNLCPGTEKNNVFASSFLALLPTVHCLQLQAAVPPQAFCHATKKAFRFFSWFCFEAKKVT